MTLIELITGDFLIVPKYFVSNHDVTILRGTSGVLI